MLKRSRTGCVAPWQELGDALVAERNVEVFVIRVTGRLCFRPERNGGRRRRENKQRLERGAGARETAGSALGDSEPGCRSHVRAGRRPPCGPAPARARPLDGEGPARAARAGPPGSGLTQPHAAWQARGQIKCPRDCPLGELLSPVQSRETPTSQLPGPGPHDAQVTAANQTAGPGWRVPSGS